MFCTESYKWFFAQKNSFHFMFKDEKLKTEEEVDVLEQKVHFIKEENLFENNDFNQLEQNAVFVQDTEIKPDITVLMQDKLNPEPSAYQSDSEIGDFENSEVDNGVEKIYRETLSNSKKLDKHILKKRKLRKKHKEFIDEDENVKLLEDINNPDDYSFPTEIIKDGKLIIKGSSLAILIAKFYNLHCNLCPKIPKFPNLSKVHKNIIYIVSIIIFNSLCIIFFFQLMKHYDLAHNVQGYVTCCNTQFHQHRSIYMHMARHLQPSAFE